MGDSMYTAAATTAGKGLMSIFALLWSDVVKALAFHSPTQYLSFYFLNVVFEAVSDSGKLDFDVISR